MLSRNITSLSYYRHDYTANILTVLSIAFGSVTCVTVILLHILQPKIAIDFRLYSSVSLNVICTVIAIPDKTLKITNENRLL